MTLPPLNFLEYLYGLQTMHPPTISRFYFRWNWESMKYCLCLWDVASDVTTWPNHPCWALVSLLLEIWCLCRYQVFPSYLHTKYLPLDCGNPWLSPDPVSSSPRLPQKYSLEKRLTSCPSLSDMYCQRRQWSPKCNSASLNSLDN